MFRRVGSCVRIAIAGTSFKLEDLVKILNFLKRHSGEADCVAIKNALKFCLSCRTFYETLKTSAPKVSFSFKLVASAVSGWAIH
jgi:hypothetical protein